MPFIFVIFLTGVIPHLKPDGEPRTVKILVLNSGSSSLKFQMYKMENELVLAKGIVERIGLGQPVLKYERHDGLKTEEVIAVKNHDDALRLVCQKLVDPAQGVMQSLGEVQAVGHRVVHGGEKVSHPVRVDDSVKTIIRDCSSLAPLHNPPNLSGIEACEHVFSGIPNVAVFDTAFHQSMPAESYLYAIPYEYYTKYGIRKYGFHGTSHKFIADATAEYLQKPLAELKLITCHLGNGCSVAAIHGGNVLDTSMGLTPLMGLVMGTRCGDIDPGVLLHLAKLGMKTAEIDALLNKNSGILGLAGIGSSDMRDIEKAVRAGNAQAKQALDMFAHRLVYYIGAYYTLLGGADAVVLTGGIGENSAFTRAHFLSRLEAIGCKMDAAKNDATRGKAGIVSTPESTLKAVIMPTNEELMIARETLRVLGGDDARG